MKKQHHPPQPALPAALSADALLQQAMAHHRAGELSLAEALYRQVLQLAPGQVDALYLLGVMAYQLGQFAVALELLDHAILTRPDLAEPYAKRGEVLHALGRDQEAIDSFDHAPPAQARLPRRLQQPRHRPPVPSGKFHQAIAGFDHALRLKSDFPEALVNRALALHALKEYDAAADCCDQAIRLRPDFAEAHANRGNALQALRQYSAAVASYDIAVRLKPDVADVHYNRGLALQGLGRSQDALASFDRALELRPDFSEAHRDRGNALFRLSRYPQALAAYDAAIRLQPDLADAHLNRGSALNALGRYTEALESLDQAIRLQADLALAWSSRAASLQSLLRYQESLENCDQALRLDPACFEAYANRGALFLGMQQYPAALADFDHALALNPDIPFVRGMRLQTARLLCDWDGLEADTRDLEARIGRGEKASVPFPLLALSDSPALQRRAAEIYARDKFPPPAALPLFPPRVPRDRIRIGYYSADFHTHAICNLMVELFERSDRTRFELFAFSFGATSDEMTQRVAAAMDHFVDVRSLSGSEIAARSRELEIDIAVDLMGFTLHGRTGIFAHRAAPIQVNYLGYPATMGVDYIDYIIADETLVPASSRQHYSERIVYLPDTFQATNSTVLPGSVATTRAAEGLPEQGFVFCCFNSNAKIGPATFDLWMRILGRVPGSILWLLEDNPTAAVNLRKEAAQRGIPPDCLRFAERVPLAKHLSRQRLADLFLDTFPFNAGATASPALWAGLPVLTCMGQTFAARMAASLLRCLSLSEPALSELIASTPEEYEALAVALAIDPARLVALREKLDRSRLTSALFDTPRLTRHLEAAYTAMLACHRAGSPARPHPHRTCRVAMIAPFTRDSIAYVGRRASISSQSDGIPPPPPQSATLSGAILLHPRYPNIRPW